jgi:UDP:flavonoid glycosyltransferase YjiC (YdhE family)
MNLKCNGGHRKLIVTIITFSVEHWPKQLPNRSSPFVGGFGNHIELAILYTAGQRVSSPSFIFSLPSGFVVVMAIPIRYVLVVLSVLVSIVKFSGFRRRRPQRPGLPRFRQCYSSPSEFTVTAFQHWPPPSLWNPPQTQVMIPLRSPISRHTLPWTYQKEQMPHLLSFVETPTSTGLSRASEALKIDSTANIDIHMFS